MQPNFGLKHLAQRDIVDWMHSLKPSVPLERQNIRQRIRDARKRGELSKGKTINNKLHVDTREFFDWACSKKGWEVLSSVLGLPRNATVNVTGVAASTYVEKIYASKDKEEIAQLRAELQQCQEELAKYKLRSQQASKFGKLGGRPRVGGR